MFCVLNSVGQVVTWKLTRGLSFDEIAPALRLLNERLRGQGVLVSTFYVNICCSWRKKLVDVFGQQLNVYLDIFHAVQRIS